MSKTVLCRLPNHVGDCMMTLPALQLLADSGFTPSLIGKRFAEDLMAGMGWRYDPIEGQVLKDLGRVKEIAQNTGDSPRGVLFRIPSAPHCSSSWAASALPATRQTDAAFFLTPGSRSPVSRMKSTGSSR